MTFFRPFGVVFLVGFSAVLDLCFNILPIRKRDSNRSLFPASGIVTGLALSLLLESHFSYIAFLAAFIAIASKSLIRIDDRHVFNPANLGALAVIVLYPQYCTITPAQWSGSTEILIYMFTMGTLVSASAGRISLSFTYLIGFVAISSIVAYVKGSPPLFMPGTMLGLPAVLFAFHMISDPATSPASISRQISLGLAIAALDVVLRLNSILYAPFLALAVCTAARPLFTDKKKSLVAV